MTREKMMDNVIRKFGFEVKETISFCRMCECGNVANERIEARYKELMEVIPLFFDFAGAVLAVSRRFACQQ